MKRKKQQENDFTVVFLLLFSFRRPKGSKFRELKDSIVIFICLYDPYRLGLHRYTFRKTCQEAQHLELEDGTQTIVLSTEGRPPPALLIAFILFFYPIGFCQHHRPESPVGMGVPLVHAFPRRISRYQSFGRLVPV